MQRPFDLSDLYAEAKKELESLEPNLLGFSYAIENEIRDGGKIEGLIAQGIGGGIGERIFRATLQEIRELVCSESEKYKTLRQSLKDRAEPVIVGITAAIAAVVGDSVLIAPIIVVVLNVAFSVGIELFCAAFSEVLC